MSTLPPAGSVDLADTLDAAATAWLAFCDGMSLTRAVDQAVAEAQRAGTVHARLRAAVLDVASTAVRQRARTEALLAQLARRPPDPEVGALLAVALAQLQARRYPPHTLVDQTVRAAQSRASTRAAAGFVNAVLRSALRAGPDAVSAADPVVQYNAPRWWIERVQADYPAEWRDLLAVGLAPPPLTLRVNARRSTVEASLLRLAHAGIDAQQIGEVAVRLATPRPVEAIPGFAEGEVSVQDAGAQLAARWLDAQPGTRVLDACAAPGGKTAHLLERADVTVDAIEADPARVARITANLQRLHLSDRARVIVADAAQPTEWFDGTRYPRILLDAPCTASGIVRRHPDVPWLRRAADVALLARQQRRLLDALWPLLAPTGRLLYVVCSVFPEEGVHQIASFCERHADAALIALPGQPAGVSALQLLPQATRATATATPLPDPDRPLEHDGFCYALIEKRALSESDATRFARAALPRDT